MFERVLIIFTILILAGRIFIVNEMVGVVYLEIHNKHHSLTL